MSLPDRDFLINSVGNFTVHHEYTQDNMFTLKHRSKVNVSSDFILVLVLIFSVIEIRHPTDTWDLWMPRLKHLYNVIISQRFLFALKR